MITIYGNHPNAADTCSPFKNCRFYDDVDRHSLLNDPKVSVRRRSYCWSSLLNIDPGKLLLMSDNYDELAAFIQTKKVNTVTPIFNKKDKIFIHKSSVFPSLLFSKLDTDLKRTVKESAAKYAVIDPNINKHLSEYQIRVAGLSESDPSTMIDMQMSYIAGKLKDQAISIVNNAKLKLNVELKYYVFVNKDDYILYEQSCSPQNNFILTEDLVKHLYKNMPKITDTEFDNLIAMLIAKDHESVIAGYNMAQYYNLSDKFPELLVHLTKEDTELPNIASAKFLYNLMGCSSVELNSVQNLPGSEKLKFRIKLINKMMCSDQVRQRVLVSLRQDLFEEIEDKYKNQFNTLSITLNFITNDSCSNEIGKTEVSDREVEAE